MEKHKLAEGFGIGVILVVAVILMGLLRDFVMAPAMGKYAGYIISTAAVICLVIFLAYIFVKSLRSRRRKRMFMYYKKDLLFIGVSWFIFTALIELFLRHYILGDVRVTALSNYDAFNGGLLGLVLLSELISPYIIGAILL